LTLIELLIVIGIIGLLAGLLLGAVILIRGKTRQAKARNDITQLSNALEQFKHKYGFYPPSRIRLRERYSEYSPNDMLDVDSVWYIERMAPRITDTWATTGIDWNQNGQTDAGWHVTLQGDQCLVFFLGGLPIAGDPPGCLGFSTNVANPAQLGGDRLKLYEFDTTRLVDLHGNGFYSYLDPFDTGQPYAYFVAYQQHIFDASALAPANPLYVPYTQPYYNRYANYHDPDLGSPASDCQQLGVYPYASAFYPPSHAQGVLGLQYLQPSRFQILSAGPDGVFGMGTLLFPAPFPDPPGGTPLWTALTADTTYSTTNWNAQTGAFEPLGHDDLSNFYDWPLGQSQ
jgi:general secretion pathway protein G